MDQHKKLMDEFLQKLTKSKTSPVLSDEKYNTVIKTIQHPELCTDYNLKQWVEKRKRFQLMDLPGLGICDALVVPAKGKILVVAVSVQHFLELYLSQRCMIL